jgi:hypothetical protein
MGSVAKSKQFSNSASKAWVPKKGKRRLDRIAFSARTSTDEYLVAERRAGTADEPIVVGA